MIKRIIFIAVAIVLLFYLGQQIFWYTSLGGNVLVYISNQSKQELVDVEVFLDGEKHIDDKLSNEFFHDYKFYPLKASIGNHVMEIQANQNSIIKELSFMAVPLRFVVIEFVEGDYVENVNQKSDLLVHIESKPPVIE